MGKAKDKKTPRPRKRELSQGETSSHVYSQASSSRGEASPSSSGASRSVNVRGASPSTRSDSSHSVRVVSRSPSTSSSPSQARPTARYSYTSAPRQQRPAQPKGGAHSASSVRAASGESPSERTGSGIVSAAASVRQAEAQRSASRASEGQQQSGSFTSVSYPPSVSSEASAYSRENYAQAARNRSSLHSAQPSGYLSGQGSAEGAGFYRRHLSVMLPVTIVVAVVLVLCVFDVASSWGKIHSGVTVEGVDVGGLTVEEAATRIENELGERIGDDNITVYEGSDSDVAVEGHGAEYEDDSAVQTADAAGQSSKGSDTDDDDKVEKWKVDTQTLDVGVNGTKAAEAAYECGRKGNVVGERIEAWVSGVEVDTVITYDEESFRSLVDEINEDIGEEVVNSRAKVKKGKATLSEGSDGWLLDEDEFVERLSDVYFDSESTWCTTPMHTVTMYIQPETAQKIVDQINGALEDEVTIVYEDDSWTMDAEDMGSVIGQKVLEPGTYLSFGGSTQTVEEGSSEDAAYDMSTGRDGSSGYVLQAFVNQKELDEYLTDLLGKRATGGAKDASFDTSSGEVVIVESVTGTGPDLEAAELTMQEMLFGSERDEERVITLEDTTIVPDFTTEDAEALGIEDKLSSWSIPISGTSSRQHNIELLCSMIDGSLVAPGDTWSFNETTGERTEEKGFETAPVIVNGTHEDQLGGGICQVATCVFNAACYAGLGIGTRANHSFYISAYDDEGFADATVSWETPDLQWINDTENYILLSAGIDSAGNVTVSLWGVDEGRTVTCDRGEWKEGEEYETIEQEDDELWEGQTEVVQEGVDGRSIYIRYIAKSADGEVLHDINFHSVYSAQDEIIAVGTKTSETEEDDEDEEEEESSSGGSSSGGSSSETDDDDDEESSSGSTSSKKGGKKSSSGSSDDDSE